MNNVGKTVTEKLKVAKMHFKVRILIGYGCMMCVTCHLWPVHVSRTDGRTLSRSCLAKCFLETVTSLKRGSSCTPFEVTLTTIAGLRVKCDKICTECYGILYKQRCEYTWYVV